MLSNDQPLERIEIAPYGIFGTSPAMRKIVELLPRVAPSRCAVLLYGERGTGREMLARAIHGHGRRADAPFVTVDCSSPRRRSSNTTCSESVSQRRSDGNDERRSVERVTRQSKLYAASGGTLFLMHVDRNADARADETGARASRSRSGDPPRA